MAWQVKVPTLQAQSLRSIQSTHKVNRRELSSDLHRHTLAYVIHTHTHHANGEEKRSRARWGLEAGKKG